MKKLLLLLMVVGLVMAAGGRTSVLAQTTYELYADVKSGYSASDFRLRYIDLDGDGKFSLDELISFSGVGWVSKTYTEILGVPSDTTDSPLTDGPYWDPMHHGWWHFYNPGLGEYVRPNAWTYSQVPVSSEISVSKPGITVVQDQEGDLLLRNCNADYPNILCSLHPLAPLSLPGYFDIKSARITQIGRGLVDLVIKVYEPIPAVPLPFQFIDYFWQFEGGCVLPQLENKAGIRVHWDGSVWTANWYVITNCDPRESALAGSVPFEFIEDGVKVRVALADLLTATDPGEPLVWHVGARRIPFQDYQLPGYPEFPYTVAVDYAPDVIELIPCYPPPGPCYWKPEVPATWERR